MTSSVAGLDLNIAVFPSRFYRDVGFLSIIRPMPTRLRILTTGYTDILKSDLVNKGIHRDTRVGKKNSPWMCQKGRGKD